MLNNSWMLIVALVLAGVSVFWFIVSVIASRNDVADMGWGTYFIAGTVTAFLCSTPLVDLRLIPLGLVVIWAVRLSWHIKDRILRTSEDRRYAAWRSQWGNGWYFYVRSFFQIFLLQVILACGVMLPVIVAVIAPGNLSLPWVIAGVVIWIFGFFWESLADHQLKNFLKNPENKGQVMQSGLWAYSRHPNYFGEVVQWWGLGVMVLGVSFGWIGLLGPLLITYLIVYVSGIPLAEQLMKNNPVFQSYQKTTSPFFPLPRRVTRMASPKTIAAILIEFGPLVLFFITFEIFNFMTSVIILIAAVSLALVASVRLYKKIAVFPLVASTSVIIFGLLTVLLHNPFFIIFKDTLYFGIFAIAILVPLIFKRLVLKSMFSEIFAITDRGWTIISINWGIFMALVAGSNEIARVFFSSEQWVEYKFIVLVILIVFSLAQFLISRHHRLDEASSWGLRF